MELYQKFAIVDMVKWYNHKPGSSVVVNDRAKILQNFNIQTDHVVQHRRDKRTELKEQEKDGK